jgi:hypothetical protein
MGYARLFSFACIAIIIAWFFACIKRRTGMKTAKRAIFGTLFMRFVFPE